MAPVNINILIRFTNHKEVIEVDPQNDTYDSIANTICEENELELEEEQIMLTVINRNGVHVFLVNSVAENASNSYCRRVIDLQQNDCLVLSDQENPVSVKLAGSVIPSLKDNRFLGTTGVVGGGKANTFSAVRLIDQYHSYERCVYFRLLEAIVESNNRTTFQQLYALLVPCEALYSVPELKEDVTEFLRSLQLAAGTCRSFASSYLTSVQRALFGARWRS